MPSDRSDYNKKYRETHKKERSEYQKEYYRTHKEYYYAKGQKYYYEQHERILARMKSYKDKNRAEINKKNKVNQQQRRIEVWKEAIAFFGPCACCGESRVEFLAVDHINGGGSEQRKAGEETGWKLLRSFSKRKWPEELKKEYRLLCHNCNMSLGHFGYCPHNPEMKQEIHSKIKPTQ